MSKFDSRSDECIFLGYSTTSRAFRVYNLRTSSLMESINAVIDATGSPTPATNEDDNGESPILDTEPQSQREAEVQTQEVETAPSSQVSQSPKCAQRNITPDASVTTSPEFKPSARVKLNHPAQQVIGSVSDRMKTRRQIRDKVSHMCYVLLIEPKNIKEALLDDSWVNAMQT